jgi:hypothetical protein
MLTIVAPHHDEFRAHRRQDQGGRAPMTDQLQHLRGCELDLAVPPHSRKQRGGRLQDGYQPPPLPDDLDHSWAVRL